MVILSQNFHINIFQSLCLKIVSDFNQEMNETATSLDIHIGAIVRKAEEGKRKDGKCYQESFFYARSDYLAYPEEISGIRNEKSSKEMKTDNNLENRIC